MDMFGMEDFTLLVDDWNLGQSFDSSQFDDAKVTQVKDDRDFSLIKTEPQADMLDSFLGSPSNQLPDPFGDEWMENADLLQFLDVAVNNTAVLEHATDLEIELQTAPSPPETPEAGVLPVVEENQARISSYEFLQSLLKQSELIDLAPASHITPPTSPEPQVAPKDDCIVLEETTDTGTDFQDAEFIGSPLSADDVESLLSSAAPSPSSTVDTSSLYGDSPQSNSTITYQSSDLYHLVANVTKGHKSRSSPYSRPPSTKNTKSKGRKQTACVGPEPSELELELMSKKDRKKLQNKNAAIRYRQKKKEEASSFQVEVEDLETVNSNLHEKVEQLQREIQYMKDLIQEVQRARGVKLSI